MGSIIMHLINHPKTRSNEVQNMNNYLIPSKLTTELKQTLLTHRHQILNRNSLQLKILFIRLGLGLVEIFSAVSVQISSTIKSGHDYSIQTICFVKELCRHIC